MQFDFAELRIRWNEFPDSSSPSPTIPATFILHYTPHPTEVGLWRIMIMMIPLPLFVCLCRLLLLVLFSPCLLVCYSPVAITVEILCGRSHHDLRVAEGNSLEKHFLFIPSPKGVNRRQALAPRSTWPDCVCNHYKRPRPRKRISFDWSMQQLHQAICFLALSIQKIPLFN